MDLTILILLGAIYKTSANIDLLGVLSDIFIEEINNFNTTWIAGRNFAPDTSLEFLNSLLGVFMDDLGVTDLLDKIYDDIVLANLPEQFDSREEWKSCPSLHDIFDQGGCGSCWAITTANVLTDRQCIHSNGREKFRYSVQDLVSCCNNCGEGCKGGYLSKALKYYKDVGIVSGGAYNANEGCYPYELPPCNGRFDNCITRSTPGCKNKCADGYPVKYENDKKQGDSPYQLKNVKQIMADISKNGPVIGSFDVYEDFISYHTGIYQHVKGELIGGHAVRILGWGVENNVPYWLAANSWSENWGDKGYFKIIREKNECQIETSVITGSPKL